MQKVGQIVYSQAGAGEGGAPPPPDDGPADGDEGPPEGTVEGEFREV